MSVRDPGKSSKVGTAIADLIQKPLFKRNVTPRDPADHAFNTLTADEDVAKPPSGWDLVMARARQRAQASGEGSFAPGETCQTGGQEDDHDQEEDEVGVYTIVEDDEDENGDDDEVNEGEDDHDEGDGEEDDDDENRRSAPTGARHKRSDLQHGFLIEPILCKLPEWVAVTDDFLERAVLGVVDFMLGVDPSYTRLNAKGRFVYIDVNGEPWYVVTREQLADWLRIAKPNSIRYAVERLVRKGFLHNITHTRGRSRNAVAMRLRINWPDVEQAYERWLAEWDDTPGRVRVRGSAVP